MDEQIDVNRRKVLHGAAATALVTASASGRAEGSVSQEKTNMAITPAFESQSSLQPLPFAPAKLAGLSERLIQVGS